jgi:hypothetical protein
MCKCIIGIEVFFGLLTLLFWLIKMDLGKENEEYDTFKGLTIVSLSLFIIILILNIVLYYGN